MIEAAILDFDGLILDTESTFRRSWEEIYTEHGLSVPEAVWASWVGSSADSPEAYEYLERHLGRSIDRHALQARRMTRELELLEAQSTMPGVDELTADARRRGLRLAIASSSEYSWVSGHLQRLGLLDRFEAIVSADDVTVTKPAPDLYRTALARLGVHPEQAIAFEDSAHGVAAAVAAGLFCIAVPNPVTRHSAFDAADLVLQSLADCSLDDLLPAAEALYRDR